MTRISGYGLLEMPEMAVLLIVAQTIMAMYTIYANPKANKYNNGLAQNVSLASGKL